MRDFKEFEHIYLHFKKVIMILALQVTKFVVFIICFFEFEIVILLNQKTLKSNTIFFVKNKQKY